MFNTTTIVILGILVVVSIILSTVALTKKGGSLTGPQGPAGYLHVEDFRKVHAAAKATQVRYPSARIMCIG